MFNDKQIEALEDRVRKLEHSVYVYTDNGTMLISTILYMLLHHLKLRITTTPAITKVEEITDAES